MLTRERDREDYACCSNCITSASVVFHERKAFSTTFLWVSSSLFVCLLSFLSCFYAVLLLIKLFSRTWYLALRVLFVFHFLQFRVDMPGTSYCARHISELFMQKSENSQPDYSSLPRRQQLRKNKVCESWHLWKTTYFSAHRLSAPLWIYTSTTLFTRRHLHEVRVFSLGAAQDHLLMYTNKTKPTQHRKHIKNLRITGLGP